MDASTKPSTRSTPLRRTTTPSSIILPSSSIATPSSLSSAVFNTPGTSGSNILEPRSEYLRDILKDRYASTASVPPSLGFSRSSNATPLVHSLRSSTATASGVPVSQPASGAGEVDAWMLATSEASQQNDHQYLAKSHGSSYTDYQKRISARETTPATSGGRRARRANSVTTAGPSDTPARALGLRETEALLDRQSKENFDLKLRLCLQEERIAKLSIELEEARCKVAETDRLRANLDETEDARSDLIDRVHFMESELEKCKSEHEKLNCERDEAHRLQEELVAELEKRDVAVNEAVSMILSLQNELDQLKASYSGSRTSVASGTGTGYDSEQFSLYVSSQSPAAYPSPTSFTDSRNEGSSQAPKERTLVRSSERLRRSRDRLSLPLQVPSPRLLSVQTAASSRPSTGAADSEYYSAQSSFSPVSSSSFLTEATSNARSTRKIHTSHHAPLRHPQISRIQTNENPPSRLRPSPETRNVSNSSSQFTRESPDSAPLTCESRDSMRTMESVTTASSSPTVEKRVRDNSERRRSLIVPEKSHIRSHSRTPAWKGHARSRSANEIPSFTPPPPEHYDGHNLYLFSHGQPVDHHPHLPQHPMSAATPSGRFPDRISYARPHRLERSQTAASTPVQPSFSNRPSRSRGPRQAPHSGDDRDYFNSVSSNETFAGRYNPSTRHREVFENSQYEPSRTYQIPVAGTSGDPSLGEYSLYSDTEHGVSVHLTNDPSDAFEVASTVATHEDMAYDSSSSTSKFNGPAFDVSSSDDEGEVSLGNSDMLPGSMTHGVRLSYPHEPLRKPIQQQRPPNPPERRSSHRASLPAGLGFLDGRKGGPDPSHYTVASKPQHVQFVTPQEFSRSLPASQSAHAPRSSGSGSKHQPSQPQPAPVKSRARRLTDGPVGFLSFGMFGRKG